MLMSYNSISCQNSRKCRRRKHLCQIISCTNNVTDQVNITTDVYGLVKLKVCKKCKKIYENRPKNKLSTNIRTELDSESSFEKCVQCLTCCFHKMKIHLRLVLSPHSNAFLQLVMTRFSMVEEINLLLHHRKFLFSKKHYVILNIKICNIEHEKYDSRLK